VEENTNPINPQVEVPVEENIPTKSKLPLIIMGVLLVILVGAGTFFLGKKSATSQTAQQVIITQAPSPTQTIDSKAIVPSSEVMQDETASWKTYNNSKIGYSFKAPTTWNVNINNDDSSLSHQDAVGNVSIGLVNAEPGMVYSSPTIEILFPISIAGPHTDLGKQYENGLKGLENSSNWGSSSVDSSKYITIDGKKAFVVRSSTLGKPKPTQSYDWCGNCITKYVDIDLGNGKILHIEGLFTEKDKEFEDSFDSFYSTIKFK